MVGPLASEVEVDLPDLTRMVLVVNNDQVGKPTMDAMIRQALERRASTVDITSVEAPL